MHHNLRSVAPMELKEGQERLGETAAYLTVPERV